MMFLWQKQAARKSILSWVGTDRVCRIERGGRNDIYNDTVNIDIGLDQCDLQSSAGGEHPDARGKCKTHRSDEPLAEETQSLGRIFGRHLWSLSITREYNLNFVHEDPRNSWFLG